MGRNRRRADEPSSEDDSEAGVPRLGEVEPGNGRTSLPAEEPASRLNAAAYWALWLLVSTFVRLSLLLRVVNRPSLQGGYVLVANHGSYLDPILLGVALRRRLTFLMTVIHYRSPLLGWFYRLTRSIPLAVRGGNRDPLRAAKTLLARGEILGVFPEGGLTRDGGLLLGSPGAVSLVMAQKVPIVPVAIVGANELFPPGARFPRLKRVEIRFGEPITYEELIGSGGGPRKLRLARAKRRIMDTIADLAGTKSREADLEALQAERKDSESLRPHSL